MQAWHLTLDESGEFRFEDHMNSRGMLADDKAETLLADLDWELLDELDDQAA